MFLLNVGLSGVWAKFQGEMLLAAYIFVALFCVWVIWKRAFIPGFIGLLGMSIFILFLQKPEALVSIGQYFGRLLGIG